MIRVQLAERELAGRFEALDDAGRLVLVDADGAQETIAAGDVVQLVGPEPSQRGSGEK